MRIIGQYLCLLLGVGLLAACVSYEKKLESHDTRHAQYGIASWYGPSFHGKPTANGEPYDMWALTAAHKTLPFETWVHVRKMSTGETVRVRINDRGPFIKGRVIDLSYAAARELRMIGEGTAEVTLTILNRSQALPASQNITKRFWVQAGSFTTLTDAMTLRERLAQDYERVRVNTVTSSSGERHRVQIGAFNSKSTAQSVVNALKKDWKIKANLIMSN